MKAVVSKPTIMAKSKAKAKSKVAKVTKVRLVAPLDGMSGEFELTHAERILRIRNTRWRLPEDSEYTFENGFICTRHTKED